MNPAEENQAVEAAQARLERKRKDATVKTSTSAIADFDLIFARMKATQDAIPPEERERREAQRRLDEAQRQQAQALEVFAAANCPARHTKAPQVARSGPWGKTEARIATRLGSGFLVALVGLRGCGKTQLAVEVIRRNAQEFRRSIFCTAMQFFMDVKAGYKDGGESEKSIVDHYCRPALLVIDELGKRGETEWEQRLLYELINRRYNALRDTLIISNQEAKELENALGPSIVSRMRETGGIIDCKWESYRK